MKVVWSEQADRGWREIARYISRDFGRYGLKVFKERTKECEAFISKFPKGSNVAWVDEETGIEYRWRSIHHRSKMLYFIDDNKVVIADFWDVRSDK